MESMRERGLGIISFITLSLHYYFYSKPTLKSSYVSYSCFLPSSNKSG